MILDYSRMNFAILRGRPASRSESVLDAELNRARGHIGNTIKLFKELRTLGWEFLGLDPMSTEIGCMKSATEHHEAKRSAL